MKQLYDLGIFLYGLIITFFSFFNPKAKRFIIGRKSLWENLNLADNAPVIWFHAASLGEFEQGRPVIEACKAQYPSHTLVLSFFSPSGYEIQKNYPLVDIVSYLPLDTASNMSKWFAIVRPQLVILIKYEFWHNLINEANFRKIPIIAISSIFNSQQIFFKSYGGFMRKTLAKLDFILVQDEASKDLLNQHQIQAHVTGDTRFDRVHTLLQTKPTLDFVHTFCNGQFTVVAGSIWKKGMDCFSHYINHFNYHIKYILVPHEINLIRIRQFIQHTKASSITYSNLLNNPSINLADYDVLIIDKIGLLTSIYPYASLAYVGGAFGKKGIHNVLEPACFGVPLFYGPHFKKTREATDLLSCGASKTVYDQATFNATLSYFYKNTDARKNAGYQAQAYVLKNIGATQRVMQFIDRCLA